MKLRAFPYVEDPVRIPKAGLFLKTPSFCQYANRKKCEKYYVQISNQNGAHTCPYGFSSFVLEEGNERVIYTGLKLKGSYDKTKLRSRTLHDFLRTISADVLQKYIASMCLVSHPLNGTADEFHKTKLSTDAQMEKLKLKHDETREFLNFVVHEIRKLNLQIKRCSEELNKELEKGQNADGEFLAYRVHNIFGS